MLSDLTPPHISSLFAFCPFLFGWYVGKLCVGGLGGVSLLEAIYLPSTDEVGAE